MQQKEYATQVNNSAIGKHFSDCKQGQYLTNLQNQFSLLNEILLLSGNIPSPVENLVFNTFCILHLTKCTNYNILAFLEALLIKYNNPHLNTAVKALHNNASSTLFPTYIHTHIHTYIHTCTHTHIHTYTHTHIHTYIHTQTFQPQQEKIREVELLNKILLNVRLMSSLFRHI